MQPDTSLPTALDTGPTEVPRGGSTRPIADISIVIPARNDARMLAHCLAAIARQTVGPREVIVVDNDSSDGTAIVARQASARVITQREHGIPISSATGFDAATGRFIARLDADSEPHERWIETAVELFAAHPEAVAVTGSGVLREDDGERHPHRSRGYLDPYFALVRAAIAHEPVFGSAFAMRRFAWERVSGAVCRHDARVHDDMDLSIHLPPQVTVIRDARLTIPISARPMHSPRGMGRRAWRGLYTLAKHYPREFPLNRWMRRIAAHATARRAGEQQGG
ncbi:glycosyltransferase involved in cell wall biosynthesis [Microcella putealis]|uniref:4,4'-diaponeurosporenoate glycosyltransferase n=1 Tax=Microcella putealis TaxID=337005 RepID=A0A4Q7LPR1_9MICO|nr:glycosyltransferase family A protein [Microcella putealis]RZS56127.1 glycosyltransferase involved in cell wall biosynthesis [Microcella putealis]TQM23442.1 glycosyltransferase involved in cell wall biosynthesis [Microcella putealis]